MSFIKHIFHFFLLCFSPLCCGLHSHTRAHGNSRQAQGIYIYTYNSPSPKISRVPPLGFPKAPLPKHLKVEIQCINHGHASDVIEAMSSHRLCGLCCGPLTVKPGSRVPYATGTVIHGRIVRVHRECWALLENLRAARRGFNQAAEGTLWEVCLQSGPIPTGTATAVLHYVEIVEWESPTSSPVADGTDGTEEGGYQGNEDQTPGFAAPAVHHWQEEDSSVTHCQWMID